MSTVFISYSKNDENIAKQIYNALSNAGVDAFLAIFSLQGGQKWSVEIQKKLKKSQYVFFIASKSGVSSAFVQQELGGAISLKKIIIPILIDIEAEDLPGWTNQYHAIDYRKNPDSLWSMIGKIAWEVNYLHNSGIDITKSAIVGAGLLAGGLTLIGLIGATKEKIKGVNIDNKNKKLSQ
jgi:hypothetical protein